MSTINFFKAKDHATKEIINRFEKLCSTRSKWAVWSDIMTAIACAIANSTEQNQQRKEKREAEYQECIKRLGGIDLPAEIFGIITLSFEHEPKQDLLGELFMRLELGNHWKGQFFTPYSICELMANINVDGVKEKINDKGWCSVNDCACGAGATLIAMANALKEHEINYQDHVVFVAQDIDRIAGMMCYIQLSLLGCPGYVVIADSLTNPIVGSALMPKENEGQEFWYTPMYFTKTWHFRRMFNAMDMLFRGN